ncbi:MAG TPA: hypothetical protein VHX15_01900 [Frankiaceae bacterium]|nr:hypothetical protein [Frankiaceae bacterium]
MITSGLIVLTIGLITGTPALWAIGALLLSTGLYLAYMGSTGHTFGGRRHYF